MLTALTGIDRHESIFAALEQAPARWIGFDRGFPTKGYRRVRPPQGRH